MKKIPTSALVTLFFIVTFFLTACGPDQPQNANKDQNPPGLKEVVYKKILTESAGEVDVDVVGIDSSDWDAEKIQTGPVRVIKTPIFDEKILVGYDERIVFEGELWCKNGCKLMQVRISFVDTTEAKVFMAAVGNTDGNGVFVIDFSVVDKVVEVGDRIHCRLVVVPDGNGGTALVLYSDDLPREKVNEKVKNFDFKRDFTPQERLGP